MTHGIGFGLGNSLHNKLLSLIDSVPLFGCSVPSTIFENSDPSMNIAGIFLLEFLEKEEMS